MRPYIVALFNQKGGISKTTTSTNLAVCLAAFGKTVLVVDLDSQGDSTKSLGIDSKIREGVFDLFINNVPVESVIRSTPYDGVWVLPSTYSLAGIEVKLSELQNSQRTLNAILANANLDCDYVVIDCPPALGILPINALAAAHAVIIPVTATPYANDGLLRTLPSIKYVQEGLNKSLLLQGVLFTIHDRNKTARRISDLIRSRLGGTVYRSQIPRDNMVIEAATAGLPVCIYAPRSAAAQAHLDFTEEFLNRHASIVAKAGETIAPHPAHDVALDRLLRWRGEIASAAGPATNAAGLRQQKSQLDRLLYGDRPLIERWHLGIIHFFIDNRLSLAMFLLLVLAGVIALLGASLEGLRRLSDIVGL
ncbi:ParA family protein [Magnetospirillum molischianum]|uniref:Chromosome partitioning protein ParA n=1 Tax=Magnetospirillum molischianum DSM 120 TaxID=1150626 RepID=H8FNM6_MAGML|nr:ParA family protein [Magnetospirillum molischianum]CCG39964.1 ATPase involved in chromosome partitioning [Magnetospirillum molischianum DSM 120]